MGRRGARPYGWADNGIDLIDTEADNLRNWAQRILAGGTLRGIVHELIANNIPTANGGTWQSITIKRALANPRMIGKQEIDGQLIDSDATPILDEDTYQRLVALFTSPERARFTGDKSRISLLSGGVARCGLCGHNLHCTQLTPRPTAYKCSERSGGCGRISVHADHLEAEVTERVLARLSDAAFRRDLTDQINALHSAEETQRQIADLESRLAELGEDFADGVIERPTLQAGAARVRVRIDTLTNQLAQRELLQDIPVPSVEQIVAWWEGASKRRRRDVVAAFLDHVTVGPSKTRPQSGIDLDRLTWVWK